MSSNNLTIIVKDTDNNLAKDAQVIVNPGDIKGKTDKNGQVILPLPNESKITIKVKLNDITQEVPYYPTADNKSNRLEINLAYLKQVQSQKPAELIQVDSKAKNSTSKIGLLIGIIVLIVAIFYWIKKIRKQS